MDLTDSLPGWGAPVTSASALSAVITWTVSQAGRPSDPHPPGVPGVTPGPSRGRSCTLRGRAFQHAGAESGLPR